MATSDLLKNLFSSFKHSDDEQFYAVARQIIADERAKNHNILARELQQILDNGYSKPVNTASVFDFEKLPRDHERNSTLVEIRQTDHGLRDVILSDELAQQFETILSEYRSRERLRTYGLKPRHKLLLAGPPGCGKTLFAEVLANELGLPLLYVRFDAVISSYLGETAGNLRKIFNFAEHGMWVVFFDEFDAVGKSRDDLSEHGELKRVINSFLQLLDSFSPMSLFVAATNHESLLDSALWRRFDEVLFFGPPSKEQIRRLLKLKLQNFSHSLSFDELAPQFEGWSHADIESVCIDAIKRCIIENKKTITTDLFTGALHRYRRRRDIIAKATIATG